jgi:hypothetical protein
MTSTENERERIATALAVAELFNSEFGYDVSQSMTCMEADTVAEYLTAVDGDPDGFLAAHAQGDDEGDEHFELRSGS